ncbi:endonuclease V [Acidobacteriota bacterium]
MDLRKASELQNRLSTKLILEWDEREVNRIAGADFSYEREKKQVGACIAVYKIPEFEVVEISYAIDRIRIPYIPGYLNFREGPSFMKAFRKIKDKPDVTLIDGNGIAHPRKMGLASYVGVLLDICTVGCAKRPFFSFIPPGERRGDYTDFLDDKKEKIGICLRTRDRVKPIFVSPGHRIDFQSAERLVLECSKFRIPEPLRTAHLLAGKLFREHEKV